MYTDKKHQLIKLSSGTVILYSKNETKHLTKVCAGFVNNVSLDGEIPGLRHFVEHIISLAINPTFLNAHFTNCANLDVRYNALTSDEYILFYMDASTRFTRYSFATLGYELSNRNFDAKMFEHEKQAVYHEIEQQEADYFNVMDALHELMKKDKITSGDILGTEETVKSITKENVIEFLDKYFTKENLVISVETDLELNEIVDLCEKYIVNKLPSNPETVQPLPNTTYDFKNPSMIINHVKDHANTHITILSKSTISKKDREPSYLLENYLLSDINGALFKTLRTERGLVYQTNYLNYRYGENIYNGFYAITNPKKVNEVIDGIIDVMQNTKANVLTERVLNKIKNKIKAVKERQFSDFGFLDVFNYYIYDKEPFANDNQIYEEFMQLDVKKANQIIQQWYTSPSFAVLIEGEVYPENIYSIEQIKQKMHKTKYKNFIAIYSDLKSIADWQKSKDTLMENCIKKSYFEITDCEIINDAETDKQESENEPEL